jgi:hypothetical protein
MKNVRVQDWAWLGWALVLIGLAVERVFVACDEWNASRHFDEVAVTSAATVVSSDPGFSARDDGENPYTEYRFILPNGSAYTGVGKAYFEEGEEIEIEYVPENPRQNRIKGTNPHASWARLSLLIGAIFLVIAGCFVSVSVRKTEDEVRASPAQIPLILFCAFSAYLLYNGAFELRSATYYQFLRWTVMVGSAIVSICGYRWGHRWAPIFFSPIAVLFNPIVPFHLERDVWTVIDKIGAAIMLFAPFVVKSRSESRANR